MQSGLGLGVALRDGQRREEGRWHRSGEEGRGAWERHDVGGIEGSPGANLPDVPPEVFGMRISQWERDGADQSRGRVGSSQI